MRRPGLGEIDTFGPQETYDAAAAGYAAVSERWWGRVAKRSLQLLDLHEGDRMLDVGCGPGALAVAAGRRVGLTGRVDGIDLSEGMLAIARERASAAGMGETVVFRQGDMHRLRAEREHDAVACTLALIFARDVHAVAARLWSLVAPGGRLVVGTLGEGFFAPGWGELRRQVLALRPGLDARVPWERPEVGEADGLRGVLAGAGAADPRVETEELAVALAGGDDWWQIVQGTGMRRLVAELTPEEAAGVRARTEAWLAAEGIQELRLSVHFGWAARPGPA